MTQEEAINICIETVEELRQAIFIPWDTGNMATHALKYEVQGDNFRVYMDFSEAPYTPYTNEPWLSPKWNGKQNPNEGWWEEWGNLFLNRLAAKLRGEISQ